jgi:hypothetical protein
LISSYLGLWFRRIRIFNFFRYSTEVYFNAKNTSRNRASQCIVVYRKEKKGKSAKEQKGRQYGFSGCATSKLEFKNSVLNWTIPLGSSLSVELIGPGLVHCHLNHGEHTCRVEVYGEIIKSSLLLPYAAGSLHILWCRQFCLLMTLMRL